MGLGCTVGGEIRWWGLCGSAFCQVVLLSRLIAHSCGNNCYSFLRCAPCFSPLVFFKYRGRGEGGCSWLIIAFTIGHSILNNADSGFDLATFPNGLIGALCITFANWGADGFMVSLLELRQRLNECCRPFHLFLL